MTHETAHDAAFAASYTHTTPTFSRATIEASQTLIGRCPDDLLGLLDETRNVLDELGMQLLIIERTAEKDSANPLVTLARIQVLASLGRRVAFDISNYAGCGYDNLHAALLAYDDKSKGAA